MFNMYYSQDSKDTRVKKSYRNHTSCGGDLASLGIVTKSYPIGSTKGFTRSDDFILQDRAGELLPKERVVGCGKRRITKNRPREIYYNASRDKVEYFNVQRCGSVCSCVSCAKRITEKRRAELKKGCDAWKNEHGGQILLLTLTNSHSSKHALKTLLKGQEKALKSFFGNRRGEKLFSKLCKKHHIRAIEVNNGENGWHPHYHFLLFIDASFSANIDEIKRELAEWWIDCCERAGLPLPDLRNGKEASKYVAKWGLEHEMTKGNTKRGKKGSYTPFDLLELSIEDKPIFEGRLPSKLFQEYAICFKGKRLLRYSEGLKSLLNVDEKTDDEIVQETDKQSISIYVIPDLLFDLVLKYRKRRELLDCVHADYKNGCLNDTGQTHKLIEYLFMSEL
jgi:ferredoxin